MIGRVLDRRYRILRLLGEGGMGSVWEAENLGTGRRVAVKLIKAEYAAHPDITKRFYREARAVAALNTAHAVQVYDCAQDVETGAPYLVMEMLAGEDLSSLIKRLGFMDPELALRICAQALHGLIAAHAAGIVHRDIKPGNLFLARGERGAVIVKLLDFGIAKSLDPNPKATKLTRTDAGAVGSPEYMSPEQISSAPLDHRTDLWSLGAVLYECLTQRSPYEGADSYLALADAIRAGPPRSVQDLTPWVSRDVAGIIYGAMAWVTDRYQSADAMLEALRRLLPRGYDLNEAMLRPMALETRQTTGERFAVKPFAKAATNAGITTAARPSLGSPGLVALIALGVAALVTVPVLVWRSRSVAATTASAEPVSSSPANARPPASPSAPSTPTPAGSPAPVVTPTATDTPSTPSAEGSAAAASTSSATAAPKKPTIRPPAPRPPQQPGGMIQNF